MTSKLKNRLGLAAAIAATALAVPASASAATTCTFDDGTNTVTIAGTGEVAFANIDRDGTEINVNNATCLDGGTAATVNNADKINVSGAPGTEIRMTIDPDGGSLAPGATAEAGTDEMEVDADLTSDVESSFVLHGKTGPDDYRAGNVAGGVGFNLNPSADDADVDVKVATNGTLNVLGNGGADKISAAGGAGFTGPMTDRLHIIGAQGNDILTGGDGDDIIEDDFDNDTVNAGPGFDLIVTDLGNDTINGGPGPDRVNYTQANSRVTVDLGRTTQQNTGGGALDTLSNIENVTGTNFNDVLTGTDVANDIEGGGGDDVLMGRGGNDGIKGGAGVNTASYARQPAGVSSGVNVSLLLGGAQNTGGAGTDTLSGISNLVGSPFDDTLTGNTQANRIDALGGLDKLFAGEGPDTLLIRDGKRDEATCGDGSDSVTADRKGLDALSGCESVAFAPPPAAKPKPNPVVPAPAVNRAPVLSRASIRPRKLPVVRRKARGSKARKATLRYTLSEAAKVKVSISRKGKRRRLGTLRQRGKAGRNKIRFSAKLGRRKLRPGSYRARIVATDATGKRSKPVTLKFRVTRR